MRRLLHLTLFVLFLPLLSSAANRHWVGTVFPPGVSNWNDIANWSATPGGAGGASIPGAADIAIFRSTNASPPGAGYFLFFANNITVQEIQILRTGPGAVPNITFTGNITLTAPGAAQPALTINGNNAGTLNFTGVLTLQGDVAVGNGAIVNSTGLTTINNNTRATNFVTTGTGVFNMQDLTINTGANAVVLGASTNSNTTSQYIVNGLLTLQSGAVNSLGTAPNKGELRVGGNIVSAVGFLPSDANLKFIGSENQTVTLAAGTQSNWNGNVFLAVDPAPVDENGAPLPIASVTLNSQFILDATGQSITFTQGILNTTAVNYLGLGAGVTAIGASNASYVDGFVRKRGTEAFTFPTGDAGFYAPIHMAGTTAFTGLMPLNPGTGLAPNYAARYLRENPQVPFPNNAPQPTDGNAIPTVLTLSRQEYFIFDFVSDIAGFPPTDYASANMPFLWLSYENLRSGGIAQPTSVAVIAWLTNRWENLSNGALTLVGGINYLRMNTRAFSAADNNPVFSFGTNNPLLNPLPVAWLDFTGRRAGSTVELAWKTASEKDNDKFTVERSADGKNFSAIGTVAGNGSTDLTSQYTFSDKTPLSSIGIYRIKQTDLNGKFSYSKEIRVAGINGSTTGIRLYPNPAPTSAAVYLENAGWRNQKVKVTIINAIGAVVREEQITFSGDSRAKVNISGIQRGSYYMSSQVNGEKKVVPFIIQ